MALLQDGLLAFFSAVGLTAVVWLVGGGLFHSGRKGLPGLLLVLPLHGEAPAMEADMRELRRVQELQRKLREQQELRERLLQQRRPPRS